MNCAVITWTNFQFSKAKDTSYSINFSADWGESTENQLLKNNSVIVLYHQPSLKKLETKSIPPAWVDTQNAKGLTCMEFS